VVETDQGGDSANPEQLLEAPTTGERQGEVTAAAEPSCGRDQACEVPAREPLHPSGRQSDDGAANSIALGGRQRTPRGVAGLC
jgi:hypothetical protein